MRWKGHTNNICFISFYVKDKSSDWRKGPVASVHHSMERVVMTSRTSQAKSGENGVRVRRGRVKR